MTCKDDTGAGLALHLASGPLWCNSCSTAVTRADLAGLRARVGRLDALMAMLEGG